MLLLLIGSFCFTSSTPEQCGRAAQQGIKCPRAQFCANGTKGCKQEGLAWMGLLAARQAWPGMEPYRAHSRAGWLLYRAGAPYYLGPIGASLPVQLILWHLRLRPALPLPRQPAVKCIKSNRVRPIRALVYWCVYYISIPRRNCSTLEKGVASGQARSLPGRQ